MTSAQDLAGGGQDPKEIPTCRWSERVGEASRILPKHRGASVSAAFLAQPIWVGGGKVPRRERRGRDLQRFGESSGQPGRGAASSSCLRVKP